MTFLMRLISLLCLTFMLCLPATLHAQDVDSAISPINTDQEDNAIANRIRDILFELGDYEDVTVDVSEGVVSFDGTVTSGPDATALDDLASRVEGVVAIKNGVTETSDIGARLDPAIERFKTRVAQMITALPLVAISAVVAAVIIWLGLWIARLKQPWERLAPNAFIAELYRQIVRIAFVLGALVIALDILNATALLSTILGAAGIIGLALGFAVRDTVENFIASVMLSIRQPFRPNDTVEINGDQGKVIRLTSRATILLSFDGNHIRIPNAIVFKSRIINYSQNPTRRFMFDILIDRNADLGAARSLVEETVQELPFVLDDPAAATWIDSFEPSGVTLVITGWVDQHASSIVLAKGEAVRQVKQALQDAGISMTDSVQVVQMAQTSTPETPPTESAAPAKVTPDAETQLDRLITAERADEQTEDLLGDNGTQE